MIQKFPAPGVAAALAFALTLTLLALPATAQQDQQATNQSTDLRTYQGPGVLSQGVGNVGSRSGEQVNLRFFGGVSGFVDSTYMALATDPSGKLLPAPSLHGIEVDLGVYGVHSWRRSQLGIDYRGSARHYVDNNNFDGTDHNLVLGYTVQSSRHLTFDFRNLAATGTYGNGFANGTATGGDAIAQIFNSRTDFLNSSLSAT